MRRIFAIATIGFALAGCQANNTKPQAQLSNDPAIQTAKSAGTDVGLLRKLEDVCPLSDTDKQNIKEYVEIQETTYLTEKEDKYRNIYSESVSVWTDRSREQIAYWLTKHINKNLYVACDAIIAQVDKYLKQRDDAACEWQKAAGWGEC